MDRYIRFPKSIVLIAITFCSSLALSSNPKTLFDVIVPDTVITSNKRAYEKKVKDTIDNLTKNRYFDFNFNFTNTSQTQVEIDYFPLDSTPKDILGILCGILSKDVLAILYFTNLENYGRNPAEVQYFLQLLGYLGMPVIAWNANNSGLKQTQRISDSTLLQLAPSIDHQIKAILSILKRYSWHKFSLLTSGINGHNDFIRALRNQVQESLGLDFKYEIIDIFTIKTQNKSIIYNELEDLAKSEARIILLYSTKAEAEMILDAANDWEITGKNYLWIVTQSVIGNVERFNRNLPPGMLGVYFNTTMDTLLDEIEKAIVIFAYEQSRTTE